MWYSSDEVGVPTHHRHYRQTVNPSLNPSVSSHYLSFLLGSNLIRHESNPLPSSDYVPVWTPSPRDSNASSLDSFIPPLPSGPDASPVLAVAKPTTVHTTISLTPPASPRAVRPVAPPRPAHFRFASYLSPEESAYSVPDLTIPRHLEHRLSRSCHPDGEPSPTSSSFYSTPTGMDAPSLEFPPEPSAPPLEILTRSALHLNALSRVPSPGRNRSVSNGDSDMLNDAGLPLVPVLKKSTSTETLGPTAASVTSSSTSGDPCVLLRNASMKREGARENSIRELLETERTYLKNLNVVLEVFYVPMSYMLKESEMTIIFCNLESLMLCSAQLISMIELQVEQEFVTGKPTCIGEIFMSLSQNFDCYVDYNANHSKAIKRLMARTTADERLSRFLLKANENPRCGRLPLSSFLLQPTQRISRYPMLLKKILHYTKPNHPDHFQLRLAADMMSGLTEKANEITRVQEDLDKCLEIRDTVDFGSFGVTWDPFAEHPLLGKRHFVIEGTVTKWKGNRKLIFHLFNDVLLLVKIPRSIFTEGRKELYRQPWSTNNIMVRPVEPKPFMTEPARFFELVDVGSGEVLLLEAPDRSLARKWMADISATCQVHYRVEAQAKRKQRPSTVVGRRNSMRRRNSTTRARSPPTRTSPRSGRSPSPPLSNRSSVLMVTTNSPTCVTTKVVTPSGDPVPPRASLSLGSATVSAGARTSLALPSWTSRRFRTQKSTSASGSDPANRRSSILSFFESVAPISAAAPVTEPAALSVPPSPVPADTLTVPLAGQSKRQISKLSLGSDFNSASFVSAVSNNPVDSAAPSPSKTESGSELSGADDCSHHSSDADPSLPSNYVIPPRLESLDPTQS
ncbi:hypothetical protein BJ085DRAFT_31938, partial [Dimargaris cristalligena]